MRKLYRSTLVAVVLAFGVVACGDDVTIIEPEPTPPPALQVTLTPQNVNLTVGDDINLAVGISGGQEGATVNISCESSNTDVVTTTVSGNNCAVTAVGPGNATVTATVQKGNQESSAGAAISVGAVQQATVTISDIMKGGETADINNVSGQLDVRMNVNFGDEQPVRLKLFVDDDIVATQEFSQAQIAEIQEMLEEADTPEEQVQQITLSFNTDYYEIEDGVAEIRSYNGDRVISAELTVATQDAEPRASNTVTVRFNNNDGLHVLADLPGTTAMDGEGRLWHGGWGEDETADVTVIPVLFSGPDRALQNMTVSLCGDGQLATEGPFSYNFACANFESERTIAGANNPGEAPMFSSQYVGTGNDGPTVILNADSEDHPFPARIDNVAPGWVPGVFANSDAIDGVVFIGTQKELWNRENWVNDEYMFSTGLVAAELEYDDDWEALETECNIIFSNTACGVLLDEEITDGGSSFMRDLDIQFYVTTADDDEPQPVDSPEDLDESNLNTFYTLHVELTDALGNSRMITQSRNPIASWYGITSPSAMQTFPHLGSHGLRTFGVDRTAPEFAIQDIDEALDFDDDYIVRAWGDVDQNMIAIELTDTNSGFRGAVAAPQAWEDDVAAALAEWPEDSDQDAALRHLAARVTGTPGSTELTRTGIVAQSTDDVPFTETPFATSEEGEFIGGPLPVPVVQTEWSLTALEFSVPMTNFGATPGYYFYQVMAQDKAGNRTDVHSLRAYLNANASPELTGLNPGGFFRGGDPVAFGGTATDPVEVLNASFALNYPVIGQLLYDRSPEEISQLFTDEITRPVDFQFETLPGFIRSLAMVDGNHQPTGILRKPNNIQARAYSGYTYEGDAFEHLDAEAQVRNHFSPFTPFDERVGSSLFANASIPGDQVEDGEAFEPFDNANNPGGILRWILEEDNGDLVATARGTSGQFPNPFAAAILVARVDSDFGEYLIPVEILTSPTGQLDSGQFRDYNFVFDGGFEAPENSELLGFHAVGLSADFDGLATQLGPEEEVPDEVFNVQFEQASYDVIKTAPAIEMLLEHGPLSTDENFTVDACEFVDGDGEPLAIDPQGMTLTATAGGCEIEAAANAVDDATHTVRATVTGAVSGEDTATTSVTVAESVPFSITIDGPATVEFATAQATYDYDVTVDAFSGGPISQLVCELDGDVEGVSVAPDGLDTCVLTVDAYDGNLHEEADFSVVAIAQEQGTDAQATDSQDVSLVLPEFAIEITGAATITAPLANEPDEVEAYAVTAVDLTGPIASLTCSVAPGTTGVSVEASQDTNDNWFCDVTVTEDADAGDNFNVIADAVEDVTGAEASAFIIVTLN